MKTLIVGGGAVGSVLCKLLAKEKEIESIVCCDINERKFKDKKIKFFKIDLKDRKKFEEFLIEGKFEHVVNSATSWINLDLMAFCEKLGINYMDMSSMWNPDSNKKAKSPYKVEQLDFHEKFKRKNIFGLINAGVAPGLDNLFARECADELDEVENIKIRLVDYSGSEDIYFAWSKEVLLEELASKPLVYKNGKFKIMEAFSGIEEFEFPKPFGKKKVALICQEEVGTIPLYIKVKNVDEKDYDDQMLKQKFLYDAGLLSKEKIKIGDCDVSPLDFTCKALPEVSTAEEIRKYKTAQFAMLVEAEGKKNNKKTTARCWVVFPNQEKIDKLGIGANFITYPTALSASLFILSLEKIKEKGVFPPEALDKKVREEIINRLKKYVIVTREIL